MNGVAGILLLALVDARDKLVKPGQSATEQTPLAFAFAPVGLLFPYYVGVAYELRKLRLLRDSTPIGGTSAGSIVSALVAAGVEESEVREGLAQLVEDVRKGVKLHQALRTVLEKYLPEDAAERVQQHRLTIGYFEAAPIPRPHIVKTWESKEDLIETILGSCNFPVFFSKWPLVKCRNAWAIDGAFSAPSGIPPLPARRTVAVLGLPHMQPDFDASDIIQPGRRGMEMPDDMTSSQLCDWVMSPAPDEKIDEMVAIGHRHARAWAMHSHVIPAVTAALRLPSEKPTQSPRLPWPFPSANPNERERQQQPLWSWLSKQPPQPSQPSSLWSRLSPHAPQLQAPQPRLSFQSLHAMPRSRPLMPQLYTQTSPEVTSIPATALIGLFTGSALTFAVLRLRRDSSVEKASDLSAASCEFVV